MNILPRRLNSGELAGAEHFNQLLEFVESIVPRASATVGTEDTGTGIILHAAPPRPSGFRPGFPGKVYVNFLSFYDAAIVSEVADQIGTAIVDNSTDEAKTYIKIAITDLEDENVLVSYEDAPDPLVSPWAEKEAWFLVADWTVPITYLPPTGADTAGQVRQYQGNGVYKWVAVAGTTLPPGSASGQMLVASKDEAVSVSQDLIWQDVPEESDPITLPIGVADDIIIYNSENEMEAVSPPTGVSMVCYDGTGTKFLVFENEFEVPYMFDDVLVIDELRTT